MEEGGMGETWEAASFCRLCWERVSITYTLW
jgi:hypothetical protein